MILTPKNWGSFQHYKDREPSWIKLHKSLLTNYEFVCLPVASKALAPMLWLLASEYKDGIIDASLDKIAFRLSMTRGDLADALNPLIQSGFFDASEPLAERRQDAIPEKEIQEEIEEEKDNRAVAKATRPIDEKFEEFWKVKPRRAGADPKAPAAKLFHAAVRSGTPADEIIAAARRWAAADAGKIGTEYLPQAVKWLRDKRWQDYPPESVQAVADLPGYYAKADSEQLDAWDAWGRETKGRAMPRDKHGGWRVEAEWPPGYVRPERVDVAFLPKLRAMR